MNTTSLKIMTRVMVIFAFMIRLVASSNERDLSDFLEARVVTNELHELGDGQEGVVIGLMYLNNNLVVKMDNGGDLNIAHKKRFEIITTMTMSWDKPVASPVEFISYTPQNSDSDSLSQSHQSDDQVTPPAWAAPSRAPPTKRSNQSSSDSSYSSCNNKVERRQAVPPTPRKIERTQTRSAKKPTNHVRRPKEGDKVVITGKWRETTADRCNARGPLGSGEIGILIEDAGASDSQPFHVKAKNEVMFWYYKEEIALYENVPTPIQNIIPSNEDEVRRGEERFHRRISRTRRSSRQQRNQPDPVGARGILPSFEPLVEVKPFPSPLDSERNNVQEEFEEESDRRQPTTVDEYYEDEKEYLAGTLGEESNEKMLREAVLDVAQSKNSRITSKHFARLIAVACSRYSNRLAGLTRIYEKYFGKCPPNRFVARSEHLIFTEKLSLEHIAHDFGCELWVGFKKRTKNRPRSVGGTLRPIPDDSSDDYQKWQD